MTAPAGARVAVLAYHKIGAPPAGEYPTWNYVPEPTFVEHLELLSAQRWRVLDFEELRRGLSGAGALPERSAVLSFDDGYQTMHSKVLPILRRFGHPAVLFVPTAYVGGHNAFDEGAEPREPICDWSELVELDRHGVSIQSHGVSHRAFSSLSPVEIREELARSKQALEAGVGRSVSSIAYPYGDPGRDDQDLGALLRATGYEIGFLYKGGAFRPPPSDRHRVTRIAMGPDSDLAALLEAG